MQHFNERFCFTVGASLSFRCERTGCHLSSINPLLWYSLLLLFIFCSTERRKTKNIRRKCSIFMCSYFCVLTMHACYCCVVGVRTRPNKVAACRNHVHHNIHLTYAYQCLPVRYLYEHRKKQNTKKKTSYRICSNRKNRARITNMTINGENSRKTPHKLVICNSYTDS